MKSIPVTVIIAMRNSESTILHALKSINKQTIKPEEIIIIDNKSDDNSVSLVKHFAKKSKLPIRVIARKQNKGVSASYNRGAHLAKTDYIILMHSDSKLPSRTDIYKLTVPFKEDKSIVATFSTILMPQSVWQTFNFWQKLLLARAVEKRSPGLNGKFDCIQKKAFLAIGGFDTKRYVDEKGVGGEDGDLHLRLLDKGRVVLSDAETIHLHYLSDDYSLNDFMRNRKLLARSYGRIMRVQGYHIGVGGLTFFIKPFLCLLPIIMPIPLAFIALAAYGIMYSHAMFTHASTLFDKRIITVPFINIYLLYYETYWMIESAFTSIDES